MNITMSSLIALCLCAAANAAGPRQISPSGASIIAPLTSAPQAAASLPQAAAAPAAAAAAAELPAAAIPSVAAPAAPAGAAEGPSAPASDAAKAAESGDLEAASAALDAKFDGSQDHESELTFAPGVSASHRALLEEALTGSPDQLPAFFALTGAPMPRQIVVTSAKDDSPGAATVVTRVVYSLSGHTTEVAPMTFWMAVDLQTKKVEFFTKAPAAPARPTVQGLRAKLSADVAYFFGDDVFTMELPPAPGTYVPQLANEIKGRIHAAAWTKKMGAVKFPAIYQGLEVWVDVMAKEFPEFQTFKAAVVAMRAQLEDEIAKAGKLADFSDGGALARFVQAASVVVKPVAGPQLAEAKLSGDGVVVVIEQANGDRVKIEVPADLPGKEATADYIPARGGARVKEPLSHGNAAKLLGQLQQAVAGRTLSDNQRGAVDIVTRRLAALVMSGGHAQNARPAVIMPEVVFPTWTADKAAFELKEARDNRPADGLLVVSFAAPNKGLIKFESHAGRGVWAGVTVEFVPFRHDASVEKLVVTPYNARQMLALLDGLEEGKMFAGTVGQVLAGLRQTIVNIAGQPHAMSLPPAAAVAPVKQKSGKTMTAEKLHEFFGENEMQLHSVEGILSMGVMPLEGRPQLVIRLEPGVTVEAARAALEKAVPMITALYGIMGAPSQLHIEPSAISASLAERVRAAFAALSETSFKGLGWDGIPPAGERFEPMTLRKVPHPEGYGFTALVPAGPFSPGVAADTSGARYFIIAKSGGMTGHTSYSQPIQLK